MNSQVNLRFIALTEKVTLCIRPVSAPNFPTSVRPSARPSVRSRLMRAGSLAARQCDLRIQRLIVAVFHIIDSKQRYRQAKRRRMAAVVPGERASQRAGWDFDMTYCASQHRP